MAFHDADMRRFGQWWMRSRRVGFGYASVLRCAGANAFTLQRDLQQVERKPDPDR